ncbi:M48 family metalloprotease [Halobellus inordinatus]|uniref:M48 family metalloprotease n=1 Tax=Halobellus inordinatus TaxID=1126236 RepID=UPI00211479A9|nr:M48 family metalloprotease [Halobellus ramosii]
MRSLEDLAERLRDGYTRLFARLTGTPIEERGSVELSSGEEMEVYWFSDDSAKFGQNVLFADAIIINRRLFDELPPESKQVVIEHERSHQQREPLIRGAWLGLVLSGFSVGLVSLFYAGLGAALGAQTSAVAEAAYFGSTLTFVAWGLNRAEETVADLDAIHAVGEDRFIRGYEAIKSASDSGVIAAIQRRLFYNSPEATKRLYHSLHNLGFYTD